MHDDENYRYIGRGKVIELSVYENFILKELIERKGKPIRYEELCKKMYKDMPRKPYDAITTIVARLRKKLKGEVEIKTKNQIGFYI